MFKILMVLFLIPMAVKASDDCQVSAMKSARKEFKKLYDQKKYSDAVKKLTALDGKCSSAPEDGADEFCWVQSDLALGLLKAGDAQACRDRLAPRVIPNVNCPCCGASVDDGKDASAAEKAAFHNYELCEKALKADLSKFKSSKCSLKLPTRTLSSTALPTKGETECLVLVGTEYGKDFYTPNVPGLEDKMESNPQIICSKLVRLTAKGQKNLTLASDDPVLGDSGYCCKIDQLGIQEDRGRLIVHVSASGGLDQPCGGSGTARATPEAIYELEKEKLTLKKDMSWGAH